tara:strand:+ start:184 stop:891 length:708 start_codon:yes stop_codon:yes gene_type:complete
MIRLFELFMNKLGQSLLENFLLFILVLGVVMPLLFFSADYIGKSFRMNQVEDSLRSVAITANAVTNLGIGSSNIATISVPTGVQDSYSEGNSLIIIMDNSEIKVDLNGQVIGNVPKDAGFHEVQVRAVGDGKIKIGKSPWIYYITPSCLSYPSQSNTDRIKIIGVDFTPESVIYSNGIPLQPETFGYLNSGSMDFVIGNGNFPPSENGLVYSLSIVDSMGSSNIVEYISTLGTCF